MAIRKIVEIDEEKCDGCGKCIPNCPEGALEIIDGKARLVSDRYCDGLGACLGACPRGAINVIEKEAEAFDEEGVRQRNVSASHAPAPPPRDCPGAALMEFPADESGPATPSENRASSALTQWPVQLELVPAGAPFFDGADLLLAADCTPFAMADFHDRLLRGRKLLVGCPKLDDASHHVDKLAMILRQHRIRSLTVVHMEVPCCFGLTAVVRRALAQSNSHVPVEEVIVSVRGEIKGRSVLSPEEGAPAVTA